MASYHNSRTKQNNRQFKLKYAKRSLRSATHNRPRLAHTLCGQSLWFESSLVEFAVKKWGDDALAIHSFNTTDEEFEKVTRERWILPYSTGRAINLHNRCFSHLRIKGDHSDFVDFDTCDWFYAKNAKNTLALCRKSRMIALTIIIKGRGEDCGIPPDGMSLASVKDPASVAAWVEKHSNMHHVETLVYANTKRFTMATLIFQRNEKVPLHLRGLVRELIQKGESPEAIAETLKVPYRSVASMKAWFHPNLQKKTKRS